MSPTAIAVAAHIALVAAGAAWAGSMTFFGLLTRTVAPVAMAFSMFFVAALIVLAMAAPSFRKLQKPLTTLPMLLVWGMFAPGMVMTLASTASVHLDGVVLNAVFGLLPIIVPAAGALILGERPPVTLPIGGALAFAGVLSVAFIKQADLSAPLTAYAMAFGALGLATSSAIFGRFVLRGGLPPLVGASLQLSGATISTGLFCLLQGVAPFVPVESWQWPVMAFLILGLGVGNYTAFNFGLRHLSASWVALYTGLMPAYGAVAMILIFGEVPTLATWLLIVLVVAGVAMPHVEGLVRARHRAGATGVVGERRSEQSGSL